MHGEGQQSDTGDQLWRTTPQDGFRWQIKGKAEWETRFGTLSEPPSIFPEKKKGLWEELELGQLSVVSTNPRSLL